MNTTLSPVPVLQKLLLSSCVIVAFHVSKAQNVGIGTNNPAHKLSVSGSIALDYGSQNDGTLNTPALIFGSGATVGISSKKVGIGGVNTLNLWTGGVQRLNISGTGNIGIGGDPVTNYKLRIYEGDVLVDNNMQVQQSMAVGGAILPDYMLRVYGHTRLSSLQTTTNVTIGGDLDDTYRLRVVGGDSRFGGDMHATGNVAFGGAVNATHRLYVHNGSSYFDGPVQVSGHINGFNIGASGTLSAINASITNTLTAHSVNTDNLTIDGKGSVRSNGPSPLRIGFDQKTVDINIAANGSYTLDANITEFSGDNDDVRVMVSQVDFTAGNTMFHSNLHITITEIDAAADTCTMVIRNLGAAGVTLKATIYLTTIAKN